MARCLEPPTFLPPTVHLDPGSAGESPSPSATSPGSPPLPCSSSPQRTASKRRKQFQRTRSPIPQFSTSSSGGSSEDGRRRRSSAARRPSVLLQQLDPNRPSLVLAEQSNSLQVPSSGTRRRSLTISPPPLPSAARRPSYAVQPPRAPMLRAASAKSTSSARSAASCRNSPNSTRRPSATPSASGIGSNVRTRRSAKAMELRQAKKKAKAEAKEGEDGTSIPVIPVAGAVVIAGVLGGPVCLIAGLKLGLFAALGGGIMGYTTGKMFEEHGETENMLKSAASCSVETEQTTEGGATEGKKKRMLRRIEEYERFEANCLKLKQLKNSQKPKKRAERSDYERSYSLPAGGALAGLEVGLTVEEKMELWRREGEAGGGLRRQSYQLARRNSLPALVEETEEEETVSAGTKRRSKSIDSFVII